MISRRDVLAATAAGAVVTTAAAARAAEFGNPDQPPQGAINATNPASLTDPGPQNPAIAGQFPSAQLPPPTDVGDLPLFWASFNNAPKRVQNGGWARQVTQADFAVSETIGTLSSLFSSKRILSDERRATTSCAGGGAPIHGPLRSETDLRR
jgi:oxalate decarboxylase